MARLRIDQGEFKGQVIHLNHDRTTLGRRPSCDVVLNHLGVSRWHAVIVREGGSCFIADTNSRNGTFVNSNRLHPGEALELAHLDRIKLAAVEMTYLTGVDGMVEGVAQLECYHPENQQIGAFLRAIREGDLAAVGVLGDWLMDHDDPRGERIAALAPADRIDIPEFWRMFGLRAQHLVYLHRFAQTRRLCHDPVELEHCPDPVRQAVGLPLGEDGGYFIGDGLAGPQKRSIVSFNWPPEDQPSSWCSWRPNDFGTALIWNKNAYCIEWLTYLVEHFLGPWGYLLNGEIKWMEDDEATSYLVQVRMQVSDNQVVVRQD